MQIRKIHNYLDLKERFYFLIYLFIQLIITFLEILGIGIIPLFIFYITSPEILITKVPLFLRSYFDIANNYEVQRILIIGSLMIFILFFIKNLIVLFSNLFEGIIIKNLNYNKIKKAFSLYLDLNLVEINTKNSSEILRNIINETPIANGYVIATFNIIKEMLLLLFIFILIVSANNLVTIAPIIFFLLISLTIYLSLKKILYKKGLENHEIKKKIIQNVQESLGLIFELKVYNLEKVYKKFNNKNYRKLLNNDLFKFFVYKLNKPILEIALTFSLFLFIYFYLSVNSGNTITLLPLLALLGASSIRVIPALNSLNGLLNGQKFVQPSFEKMSSEFELYKKIQSENNPKDKHIIHYNSFNVLRFSRINISYKDNLKDVIKDFSFIIKKNEINGVIGKSGSGKTSIIKILLGFLKINKGSIFLDDKEINTKKIKFDCSVGLVPQNIFLTDSTLTSNIALGVSEKEIDFDLMNKCIKEAELNEFVDNLPKGKNTRLGENGSLLSGGQKQRIGIARALYRNSSILIFDEFTTGLDKTTSDQIIETLKKLSKYKTIIIVTHDLGLKKLFNNTIDLDYKI